MKRTLVWCTLVLSASGCSKKSQYEKLCARLEEQACSEKTLGFSVADRMTIVVSELSDDSGAYRELFDAAVKVPAAERKGLVVSTVSGVLGAPWSCPAFDALWDKNEDYCLARLQPKK